MSGFPSHNESRSPPNGPMEVLDKGGPTKQIPAETEVVQSCSLWNDHLIALPHQSMESAFYELTSWLCDLGKGLSLVEPQLFDKQNSDIHTS